MGNKKTKLLVIGIDSATWSIIKSNLAQLKNFKSLMNNPLGYYDTIILILITVVILSKL